MSVDVTNETQWVIDPKVFSDLGIWVLDQMRVSTQSDLTIMFVDPDPIAQLHMRWMNLEGPTDVMSFPMDELRPGDGKTVMEGVLGDIVICPWVAAQQAAAAGHSTMQEMLLLTIHGILHLLGYDHVTPGAGAPDVRPAATAAAHLLRPTPRCQRAGHAARRHTRRAGPVRRRARCWPRPRFQISSQTQSHQIRIIRYRSRTFKDTEKFIMEYSSTTPIAITVILVLVAALFVWLSLTMAAAEGAVARVTRASLNNLILEVQTDSEASQFLKMKKIDKIHRVQRLIADRYATAGSCAFFRIACNVLDGVLVSSIASLWGAELWIELLSGFLFAIIVAVVSVLVRPRTAGMAKPVGIMISNSRIVSLATKLTPFARIGGDKSGSKGPGRRSKDSDLSDDEELEKIQLEQGKAAIDRLVESNDFDPEVSEMLRNVLTLSDTLTREIMVPRTDMICMERDSTLSSALKLFSRSGFSRVPVIGEDVDDLIGVAYLKDAVRATAFNPAAMERAVESIVRQPLLVPESKPVDDLFHEMQRSRQHVAVVVDEYGGIAGMVTIEDAIEQIVGELEDEHDRTQRTEPEKIGDNKWKMPARTPIADLEEIFEIDIDEDDVDTVYGLLTKILGRVPIVGASAVTRGLRLTAVDSAGRRKKGPPSS